jgi:5-methylthioadenosine/S-adenosylhomocysteine deaminase
VAPALLVRDATIIPMARRGEVLAHHDLLTGGKEIVAIGPTGTLQAPPDTRTIEANGRLLLPGFVNAHGHAGLAMFAGSSEAMLLQPWLAWLIPHQIRMTAEDVYWSSMLACLQQLRHGVTTAADMIYAADPTAQAMAESGLRGVVSYSLMESDPTGADDRQGRERLESAVEFAERWHGAADGRYQARLGPHSVYGCRFSLLEAVAKAAARGGWGIQIHCSENEDEINVSRERYGQTPPAVLRDAGCLERPILLHHAVRLTDEDLCIVDRPTVGISHNPGSNLKLQSGLARIPELRARGIAVGLGTDSCASNDTLDILKELYLTAVLHPWPEGSEPSWQALEMATIGGARALGLGDRVGSLEVGKLADLVVIGQPAERFVPGADPVRSIVYCGRGADVSTVVVDGRVLLDEGVPTALDAQRIRRECQQRRARILDD